MTDSYVSFGFQTISKTTRLIIAGVSSTLTTILLDFVGNVISMLMTQRSSGKCLLASYALLIQTLTIESATCCMLGTPS